MTLDEIKAAVDAGRVVHWKNPSYRVIKDRIGQYLVMYANRNCIGLTHRDGVTLNGQPDDFYTALVLPTTTDTPNT